MVRINLLPRELQERRKYERFYPLVFLVGGVALLLVVAAWGLAAYQVTQRNSDLQQAQETASQLRNQAEAFSVFERKEGELQARKDTAVSALAGRVNWARIATEVSMVLPDEVWIDQFTGNETAGLSLNANTPNDSPGGLDDGYKSIAKVLVRLNALDSIDDVWLENAVGSTYPSEGGADSVRFNVTTKITRADAPPATQ